MKYFFLLFVLMMTSISVYAFFGSASDSLSDAVDTYSNQDSKQILQDKVTYLSGIENKKDEATWSAFFNDCVKNNISTAQLASLASNGVSGITDFLSNFKAPTKAMTTIYNKVVSCPHAVPLVTKILSLINKKSKS
ncbi:hypothetical protein ACR9PT_11965 [Piscirickettsia salmonis]|uniref:hypothetical protein n=2 Tax=Piscirickettsia salmonis TaxID=1238 RepID=UPI003EB82289